MALPVSAGYQARIDQANAGLAGLPQTYNPRRRSSAYDTAAGLNESGYFRGINPEEVAGEGGNITYRLTRAPDGRLYQQAYRSISNQHNARGTFYSSFNERDQAAKRADIDAARNAIMRQFASQQQSITDQQLADTQRYTGDLATSRGEYADWQAQQQVPTPPAPEPAAAATPTAPTAPTMTYAAFLGGRKSTSALAHLWDRTQNSSRRFG